MHLVLRPRAEAAVDRAAAWYRKRNPSASPAFLRAFDATIERIKANPRQFPVVRRDLHRAIVKGFPYSVVFRIGDSEILVTACVHFRRHPRHWRTG